MAVVDFLNNFRIQDNVPIDTRTIAADESVRLGLPTGVVYEGLFVYQEDNDILYVLTDATQHTLTASWEEVSADNISASVVGALKTNNFKDITFTLNSGRTIVLTDAIQDGAEITSASVTEGILTLVNNQGASVVVAGNIRGPQGRQGSFETTVFRNAPSATAPDRPDPTQYTLSEDVSQTNGVPSGWTTIPGTPAAGEATYAVLSRTDPANDDPDNDGIVTLTWSAVFVAGATGPAGSTGISVIDAQVPAIGETNAGKLVISRDQGQADLVSTNVIAGSVIDDITLTGMQYNYIYRLGDGSTTTVTVPVPGGTGQIQSDAITEYSPADTYSTGHTVYVADGSTSGIYESVIDGNINNAVTDTDTWTKITNFVSNDQIAALHPAATKGTATTTGNVLVDVNVDTSTQVITPVFSTITAGSPEVTELSTVQATENELVNLTADDSNGNTAGYYFRVTGETTWTKVGAQLSDAQIKTAYENNADTNAFTDALRTRLNNSILANQGIVYQNQPTDSSVQGSLADGALIKGNSLTSDYADRIYQNISGRTLPILDTGYVSSVGNESSTESTLEEGVTAGDFEIYVNAGRYDAIDNPNGHLGPEHSLTTLEEYTGIRPLDAVTVTFLTSTTFRYNTANSDFKNNPTLHQLITVDATSISANPIAVTSIDTSNIVTLASSPSGVVIGTPVDLVFQRTVAITQLEVQAGVTEVTGGFNLLNDVLHAPNLPTMDPDVSGHWWNDGGTLVLSGSTASSGDSFDNIEEVEHFREFQTTVTYNAGGSLTVLIIPVDVPSDFLINAGSYELVSIGSTVLDPPLDVVSEAILANGTFRDVTLAGVVPSGLLSVGENTVVFKRDVSHPSDSQVNITSTRLLVTGEIDVTGLPDEDPNREDATYIKNGYIAVSGQTTQSIPDWSGLLAYEVDSEVNFRNDIYKRRGSNIPSTTGVSIVPGFSTLVSFKNNLGITGALGYADTFSFADPNIAAPVLNNGVVYRFTIGSGSTQYVVDADPGSTDVTANVGTLYGNGLQSPAASNGRIWQLRLLTPTGTLAPGYTIISVGGTEYTAAQGAEAEAALLALLAGKPDGTSIDNLDEGDQISFGGSPNTAPSEDISWELISNATLAASRYDLFEGELLSFHKIPADETEPSLNEGDIQRTLFEGRVTGLSTIPFSSLGDRTITNGTQSLLLPNGMADEFQEGDYITGRGASFPGIFVGIVVMELLTDSTNHIRFRVLSLRQDNSEAVVGEDGTNVIPGLGRLTRVGDIIQVARLENVSEVLDGLELPAGLPIRFQSRVATSGRLLPFDATVTTANPDVFNEYESRLTYDFSGTITQSSTDIDQLAITVIGTANEIGSVQGEIHSDLMGYVIHENGDTYFLANPTRVGTTEVYNFDVVSVGGGSFAEVFRDITTAVTWSGEHTIYLATEVVPYLNVTRNQEARWDAAAARPPLEIIETHSTVGLLPTAAQLVTNPALEATLYAFEPRTTGDSGVRISANNRSVVPSIVLRQADSHNILSMPVTDSVAGVLNAGNRIGNRYFFANGGTFTLMHPISDTEAATNGFGRIQENVTDNIVHLYLDDAATMRISNIGTTGVDRLDLNRHNQNVETEHGWFTTATSFNGIDYDTTSTDEFRFYAIDTEDQFIFRLGSQQVVLDHVDGVVSSGVTIQEDGFPLTTAAQTINFVGTGVTAAGTGETKTITIASTGGADVIEEHNTIPVTNTGDSAFTLNNWNIVIGTGGGFLFRLERPAGNTETIDTSVIDDGDPILITFADGTTATANPFATGAHSPTLLFGRFDVASTEPEGTVLVAATVHYHDDADASLEYVASPLTVVGDNVFYKGADLSDGLNTESEVNALIGSVVTGIVPANEGSVTFTVTDKTDGSTSTVVLPGDPIVRSQHTDWNLATPPASLGANGSLGIDDSDPTGAVLWIKSTTGAWGTITLATSVSPVANIQTTGSATSFTLSAADGSANWILEGGTGMFNINNVDMINGSPVADADRLFMSGGYINAWITNGDPTINPTTLNVNGIATQHPIELYDNIQGESREWYFIPDVAISGTGQSAVYVTGAGLWTRDTDPSATAVLAHPSTFRL